MGFRGADRLSPTTGVETIGFYASVLASDPGDISDISEGVPSGVHDIWMCLIIWFQLPMVLFLTNTRSHGVMQGWTLTYFEICPVGQVRVIFTCPN